jgi:hypothetical protein
LKVQTTLIIKTTALPPGMMMEVAVLSTPHVILLAE